MLIPNLPVAVLLLSAVLWGLSWWPLKHFHAQGLEGVPLILVAYGSVALALSPLIWRERAALRRQGRYVLLMALLGGYANLAFAAAMIYGDVVRSMMLFYLAPVWGVIGGRVFLGERIDAIRWAGVVLALTGAFLVLGAWAIVAAPPSAVDVLALTAGLAFSLNNVTCRAAQAVPLGTKSVILFVGCGLMALALMIAGGEPLPAVAASTWAWLMLFALVWLLAATAATQWAVTRLEAGRASIILIVELLAATVSATLIGGERLSALEALGGALILAAAVLEARRAG